ncbi:MAG: AAA family ATPase, partial [Candidatus Tumulicola sp.]
MHRGTYGGKSEHLGSELIGRGHELERLTAAFERARGGEGGVVTLWGSAGIGKTRLLGEFAAAARTGGARTVSAACFEYIRPPFGPFDEILRRLELPPASSGASGARTSADAASAKHARFSHIVESLRVAAAHAPLALTIDDVQWADLGSLELLAFAARALRGAAVVVVAAIRSDDIERDPTRFDMIEKLQRDAVARVDVRALSGADMRRLIANLAPAPAALDEVHVARICELAEGRPYFAEELVGAAISPVHSGDVEAPPSIRSSVLARFLQLTADDRRIVTHAAAIGRWFDAAFLAELTHQPIERVWEALVSARDLQLVRDAGETGELAFRHAITREVVYRELLTAQARAIHAEIAALFERRGATIDPTELAHHWRAAGNAVRARAFYEAAGDDAYARDAYDDACAAYRCALEGQAEDAAPGRGARCEKFARTLSICGNVPDAISWSQKAVDAYVGENDAAQAARMALWLARRHYDLGHADAATATARWALDILASSDDLATRYDAYVTLASFETLQGRNAAAGAHLASAEAIERGQDADARSGFHTVRAMVRATDRRLRLAFDDYACAIAFARESGNDGLLAWALNNFASRAAETGHRDVAMPAYAEAVARAEARNLGKTAALACHGYAFAHLLAGNLDAALAMRRRGLGITSGGLLIDAIAAGVFSRVSFLRGDGDAQQCVDAAMLERAFASGETQIIGLLAGSAAPHLDAAGPHSEADRLRERALGELTSVISSLWLLDQCANHDALRERARAILADAARDPENRAAAAHLTLFDARVARKKGDVPMAKALGHDSAEFFAAIGWPWEEGQARELAGEPARAMALYQR